MYMYGAIFAPEDNDENSRTRTFANGSEGDSETYEHDVTGLLDLLIKFTFWPRSMLFRIFISVSNPFETIVRHSMGYNVQIVAISYIFGAF